MRTKLSLLWIVVMLNMIFADIFSIMVELVKKDTMDIPGDVTLVMAVAAVMVNIPILMIYLNRILSFRLCRRLKSQLQSSQYCSSSEAVAYCRIM